MDYFHLSEDKQELLKMSNLGLAYLGDAVYEVMVRAWLCLHGKLTPGRLHRAALSYVAAPRQAALAEQLMPLLTEEETQVYKRGRNAKSVTMAKHATMADYRTATGMEALVGWLFLEENFERLAELISLGLEKIGAFEEI